MLPHLRSGNRRWCIRRESPVIHDGMGDGLKGNGNTEGMRWAVAVDRKDEWLAMELGRAVCRCLADCGCRAALVHDGEAEGLEAAVLLLLVNLANFPAYCHQLRRAGRRRPRVILWQMDPLPPPNASPQAEAVGLTAGRWRRRLGLSRSAAAMSRWQKLATLIRLREWLCKVASGPGFRRAWRLMQNYAPEPLEVDWRQIRGLMQSWRNILDARQEGWLDHLAASTLQRTHFLKARGIPAAFIPVGACEEFGCEMGLARDIEVLFLGRVKHGRRAAVLARLREELLERGVALQTVVDDCYGATRTRLLNRSRVLVNLNTYPWSPAWIRFLMAARCGAVVVSEPTGDREPFEPGVHYVAAATNELAAAVRLLLADEPARARMAAAASEHCRERLTLVRSVESLRLLV